MRARLAHLVPVVVLLACVAVAAARLEPGTDYFIDGSAPIDALARGDLSGFFDEQPLMGPLSLLLRAPLVALVYHQSLTVVYFAGVIPCVLALAALTGWLRARARERGASDERLLAVALLTGASPLVLRAVHWGHPEELLTAALAVLAVVCAGRGRPLLAGVALGLAFASKQWALIAVVPALVAAREGRVRLAGSALGVAVAFTLPMLLGDPGRFMDVVHAASSVDPVRALEHQSMPRSAHVTPFNAWWPFGHWAVESGVERRFVPSAVASLAHPLVVVLGAPLGWLLLRRRRGGLVDGLGLLTLVALLRCMLDPMSLDYYHLPALVALGALAAFGDDRQARLALVAGAAVCAALAGPAATQDDLAVGGTLRCAAYLLLVLPVIGWLARELYAAPRPAIAPERRTALARA